MMNQLFSLSLLVLISIAQPLTVQAGAPSFKRAIMVVFENTNYDKAVKQPIFAKVASEGTLFTQFMAEAHPSQPNYIAMIAGDTLGVRNDNSIDLNANHLGNLLTAKGLDWKLYAQDLPSNCFLGATSGKYARKHVPFLSFVNVQQNPLECAKVVDASTFQADVANDRVPAFSMYVPNLDNDGHDTGADYAAQWFSNEFGGVLSNAKFMKDTLIVVTFDESERLLQKNQVYTVLLGANIIPGTSVSTSATHYSILRTIEDNFGLGTLGKNDSKAETIKGIWQ